MSYGSSFPGRLQEVPGVSLDNFTGENLRSRAFFLSHCHMDHMQGLHSSEFKRVLQDGAGAVRVYMSELSAAIVRLDATTVLSDAIVVLELGTVHIQLPANKHFAEEHMTVTTVPAGHCLGSVMFLFRTSRDQTALYTGDFRVSRSDVGKFAQLHSGNEPIRIDALYVDTTFLDPEYSDFPKRSDCMDELQHHIEQWLAQDPDNHVALSTSARYGYEYLFVELARRLTMKIYVDTDKWTFYSQIKLVQAAVTNEQSARLHACRRTSGGHKHSLCGLPDLQIPKTLFVRMSAQRFRRYEAFASSVQNTSSNRLDVCFPTHCSSGEIKAFVAYYEPKRVVGFPNDYYKFGGGDTSGERGNGERGTGDDMRLPGRITPVKSPKRRKKMSPSAKTEKKVEGGVLRNLFADT